MNFKKDFYWAFLENAQKTTKFVCAYLYAQNKGDLNPITYACGVALGHRTDGDVTYTVTDSIVKDYFLSTIVDKL